MFHDHAAPLPQHQRDLVFHAQEHAAEVNGDDPVPLLLGEISRCRHRLFGAGVVEGEIKTSESFDGPVQRTLHVLGVGHVAPDTERARAEFFD